MNFNEEAHSTDGRDEASSREEGNGVNCVNDIFNYSSAAAVFPRRTNGLTLSSFSCCCQHHLSHPTERLWKSLELAGYLEYNKYIL
jgi:hypothetical protein